VNITDAFSYPAVFSASFGPGGFGQARTFTTRRAAGAAAQGQTENRSVLMQLMPLLLLFAFSVLSALPNLFTTPPVPEPRYSFSNTPTYNTRLETSKLGIPYFVNPAEVQSHPVLGAELAQQGLKVTKDGIETRDGTNAEGKKLNGKGKSRGPALAKFEDGVERIYTQRLYEQCQRGVDMKQRMRDAEVGLFGIGTDWEKVKKIENEPIPSCDELKALGVLRST